jgi:hypothetical protein
MSKETHKQEKLQQITNHKERRDLGSVWFVANCVTLCLSLIVRIEELTLAIKVRQSMIS